MSFSITRLRRESQAGINNPHTFVIQTEEWTPDDESNLKDYLSHPGARFLLKRIHRRINNRTEDLVNGQDTRKQIEELKDLILELESYADPA